MMADDVDEDEDLLGGDDLGGVVTDSGPVCQSPGASVGDFNWSVMSKVGSCCSCTISITNLRSNFQFCHAGQSIGELIVGRVQT